MSTVRLACPTLPHSYGAARTYLSAQARVQEGQHSHINIGPSSAQTFSSSNLDFVVLCA